MTSLPIYTAITFAPVQGFIEKSRKLRDLYGSSFILSYLSEQICLGARFHLLGSATLAPGTADPVISPALINVTQGVPNQILIRGEFPYPQAQAAFHQAWIDIVETCRTWIEQTIPQRANGDDWQYEHWQRTWQAWMNHTWEFFWATGPTGDQAKARLNQRKFARAWTGINWTGESSSLSGVDSRAWPHLGKHKPYSRPQAEEDAEVREFYTHLSQRLGEAIITPREFLSIPELIKRLITIEDVVNHQRDNGQRLQVETPLSFRALNRLLNRTDEDSAATGKLENADRESLKRWTGWFQGDGDKAGNYLRDQADSDLYRFSQHMRTWGASLEPRLPKAALRDSPKKLDPDGRIIYAGGDDFLGVLYRNQPFPPMTPRECLRWFETFNSQVWRHTQEPITVSVGFVWAAPNVPQRDVLQHCREAEQSAKRSGRDRIALRILFNSGNHLEWVCPWWLLEGDFSQLVSPPDPLPQSGLIAAYRDRNGSQGEAHANWTHLYNDIGALESRHAFDQNVDVALGLIDIYFGQPYRQLLERQEHWFNREAAADKTRLFTGLLGDLESYHGKDRHQHHYGEPDPAAIQAAFNTWVINLAKVGFHLSQTSQAVHPVDAIAA